MHVLRKSKHPCTQNKVIEIIRVINCEYQCIELWKSDYQDNNKTLSLTPHIKVESSS